MEPRSNSVKREPRTRAAVLDAARRLFLERGYVATTIDAIAAEAGVAVQTIYNAVGQKRDVLQAVLEAAVSGADAPRSPREFMRERLVAAEHGREVVAAAVAFWLDARTRTEDLLRVSREAAAVDRDVAEVERRNDAGKFEGMLVAADEVDARTPLRDGLDREGAAAVLWTLSHPVAYRFLLAERGWTTERYAAWLEDALVAALCGGPPRDGTR
jgi:AcrR family transcriptional regulator